MQWLTLEEATNQKLQIRGTPVPQMIELPADLKRLTSEMPIPGRFMAMGDIPSPSYQWYAWIGSRPIILECEASVQADIPGRVFLHTSYLKQQDRSGDWIVLRELGVLPNSIHIARPNYIMSRTINPAYVVFRPDPAGWNGVVYSAASIHEAEELLEFLKQDKSNENCFIGPPEVDGDWSAIQDDNGGEHILCSYPNRNTALSFACSFSARTPTMTLLVKDRSNMNAEQYFVSQGRVIERRTPR
jgi:hypothetical protein